jgi:hypothetical protein
MRVLWIIVTLAAVLSGGCRAPETDTPRGTQSETSATAPIVPAETTDAGSTSVEVRADPVIVLSAECTRQSLINRNPDEAVRMCTRALDAANALPADRQEERIRAHSNLAEAYAVSRRWPDAIREFETALRLEQPLRANSFRGGERLGMIAMVYFKMGDLKSADLYAGRAVATLKAVPTANGDERQAAMSLLRSTLQMQAEFKRAHGDEKGASRLQGEAEALSPEP